MSDSSTDALEQALALHASPGRLPLLHARRLPPAVLTVIRIAAGDAEAIASAARRTAETERVIVDAAVLYVQQVLLREGADSYRLLGVNPDADGEQIKEHYRWLMRWLHPDRHPERWEVVFVERVNRAWNSLNSEPRRRDYDASPEAASGQRSVPVRIAPSRSAVRLHDAAVSPTVLSPNTIRRLPLMVLGSLSLLAAIGLFGFYLLNRNERAQAPMVPEASTSQAQDEEAAAQKKVIRDRVDFDEKVIELSQPISPQSLPGPSSPIATLPVPDPSLDATPATAAGTTEPAPTRAQASAKPDGTPTAPDVAPAAAVASRIEAVAVPAPVANQKAAPGSDPAHLRPVRTVSAAPVSIAAVHTRHVSEPLVQLPIQSVEVARKAVHEAGRVPAPPVAVAPALGDQDPSTVPAARQADGRTPDLAGREPPKESRAEPAVIVARNASSPQAGIAQIPKEFEEAYARGDVSQMMGLFTTDATNNRGGVDAIRDDYRHLFHASRARALRLEGLNWIIQPGRIVGNGRFVANIWHDGTRVPQLVNGWIRIEAVPSDGRWKIRRVEHRNAE